MTISIAWLKKTTKAEQLVFASDSRLSAGELFDCCPKILCLNDKFAISFAGNSDRAFPMMLQLSAAMDAHRPSKLGLLTINEIKTHGLKIFDSMAKQISYSPKVKNPPEILPGVTFLLGGYSWDMKRFEMWSIKYNNTEKRFVASPPKFLANYKSKFFLRSSTKFHSNYPNPIAFGGDQADMARDLLFQKLQDKYPDGNGFQSLWMEPFEVIRDMLRSSSRSETIGGAPQLVYVYQNLHAHSLGMYWPRKEVQTICLQGRQLTPYERIDGPVIDPDTLRIEHPWLRDSPNY